MCRGSHPIVTTWPFTSKSKFGRLPGSMLSSSCHIPSISFLDRTRFNFTLTVCPTPMPSLSLLKAPHAYRLNHHRPMHAIISQPRVAPTLPLMSATVKKPGRARGSTRGQRCCVCCQSAYMKSHVCATSVTPPLTTGSGPRSTRGITARRAETPGWISGSG